MEDKEDYWKEQQALKEIHDRALIKTLKDEIRNMRKEVSQNE